MSLNPRVKAALDNERIERNLRAAKPFECPRCGAACLRGEDDDKICTTATVNPEPVGLAGEMFAKLAGLGTYDLVDMRFAGVAHLYRRNPWQIYAADVTYPIVADHYCTEPRKGARRDAELPSLW